MNSVKRFELSTYPQPRYAPSLRLCTGMRHARRALGYGYMDNSVQWTSANDTLQTPGTSHVTTLYLKDYCIIDSCEFPVCFIIFVVHRQRG